MSTPHSPARRAHGPHGRGRSRGGRSGPPHRSGAAHAKIEPLHPTETPPDIHSFDEWALGAEIQSSIAGMNISVPTPIQKLAIGPVLSGRDVIAKAETGTGKTLAFGAPMMAKIDPARASVLGLVLCPTRELAEQVCKVLAALGAPRGIKVALIVGGEPLEPQVAALKGGAQVVVGTPGRVLDLYKQRFLSFPWTEFAILDEADVMLEIGFIDDVKLILSYTPDERQTLLFSATFPPELLALARAHTKNPVEVATASGIATVDTIDQVFMSVADDDRPLALIRMIEQSDPDDVFLIFCDRRTEVDKLMRRLERMPWAVKALHGGYDQDARFRVMSAFRAHDVKALVATDVASRGLDVVHVTHVVNYSAPRDVTDYTHRIGRTGRAGRSGRAITLVTPLGMRKWKNILRQVSWKIAEIEPPGSTRDVERARFAQRREPRSERSESRPERIERSDSRGDSRPDTRGDRERAAPPHAERERSARPSDSSGGERWPVDHSEERNGAMRVREWRAGGDAPREEARETRSIEREREAPPRRETPRERPQAHGEPPQHSKRAEREHGRSREQHASGEHRRSHERQRSPERGRERHGAPTPQPAAEERDDAARRASEQPREPSRSRHDSPERTRSRQESPERTRSRQSHESTERPQSRPQPESAERQPTAERQRAPQRDRSADRPRSQEQRRSSGQQQSRARAESREGPSPSQRPQPSDRQDATDGRSAQRSTREQRHAPEAQSQSGRRPHSERQPSAERDRSNERPSERHSSSERPPSNEHRPSSRERAPTHEHRSRHDAGSGDDRRGKRERRERPGGSAASSPPPQRRAPASHPPSQRATRSADRERGEKPRAARGSDDFGSGL